MEGQLSLDITGTLPDAPAQVSAPSADFAAAHPDMVEPEPTERVVDPNARRAEQLRGSGGGFAAAVAGELEVEPVVEVEEVAAVTTSEEVDEDGVVYTREDVMAMADAIRTRNGDVPSAHELGRNGRDAARRALNKLGK